MSESPAQHAANVRFRAKHRDELNKRQREAYHAQKKAGTLPPSRMKRLKQYVPITAALCIGETRDEFIAGGGDLREYKLLTLLKLDAQIWKAYYHAEEYRQESAF